LQHELTSVVSLCAWITPSHSTPFTPLTCHWDRGHKYGLCFLDIPSAAFTAASALFVSKRLTLCICLIYDARKRQQYQVEHTLYGFPTAFGSLPPWSRSFTKTRVLFFSGVGYKGCVALGYMLSLFPYSSEPCTSLARVFPGIPLLLLSIVGFRVRFRDKYIVYLSMLCILFFLRLDVTFTMNELVGSNYTR